MQPLIFVTYDGIGNSVFEGQVLAPLLQQHKEQPHRPIHLISFERTTVPFPELEKHPLTIHILKRLPFLGIVSMWHSVYQLKKLLAQFSSYEIIARGPLAGYVCSKALDASRCRTFTVQARGLLAQEYTYTHAHARTFVHRLWHQWRTYGLEKIERAVYGKHTSTIPYTIEAVSVALKEYLITTYHTPTGSITIADKDIPMMVPEEKRAAWRKEVREELSIPHDVHVYCYNGSVKAWQCPDLTVSFFKQKLENNPKSFLLVLTMDQEPFLSLLGQAGISEKHYGVVTVAHKDMYRYLAAGDTGIIFRKPSIVNWVSRPTKALEYRAVGLKIMHNNTVEMLTKSQNY